MTFNAGALDNYSTAYAMTKDEKWLDVAASIRKYIDRFLSSPEGGFYVTEDVPRVDAHEYPRENGMAIAAYCTYSSASGDQAAIERAKKAADRMLQTHALDSGGLAHGDKTEHVIHLSDNAWLAFGLLAIGGPERTKQAAKIADVILAELEDARGGGFFARSKDPDAVGVFAVRRKPFEDNVVMLRVLARLARALPDRAPAYKRTIDRTLRAIATPEKIRDRGRFVGDFLLAREETKGVR